MHRALLLLLIILNKISNLNCKQKLAQLNTEQTQSCKNLQTLGLFVVLFWVFFSFLMTAAETDYVKMLKIASINQLTD